MSNEQPKEDKDVTAKGAVEVDEKELDQAAGGVSSGGDMPVESVSYDWSKIDPAAATVNTSDPAAKAGFSPNQGVVEKKLN